MKCSTCLVGAGVLLAAGLQTGCSRYPAQAVVSALLPVMVSYPLEREVTDYADYTGRTAAVDSVELRARVSGYLEKINFKEGTLVKKGDVLFEIDPRPFQAFVDSSKAQLAGNQALAKKAKLDNERNKTVAKTPGAVSQQDLDLYQATEDQAIAQVASS